jgi:hypothetical protein
MRYLILVLAMVLGCAAESVEPTVQIGGYGSDIVTPDIQGTDAVQGTDVEGSDVEGSDVAQPDVQGVDVEGTDVQADTQDAQVEVQEDVQVDVQPDVQPDIEIDTQADVQADTQPDTQDDVQADTQQDVQVDTQDVKQPFKCKTKADCNDGNQCTNDTCAANGACLNTVASLIECDDGNPCTKFDQCDKAGTCWAGPTPKCEDYNECTENVCNTSTGECTFKALPVKTPCKGTGCSTGGCTIGGTCGNTTPVSNPVPLQCDDGNPCTNDSCNWADKEGCVHEWIPFCKP